MDESAVDESRQSATLFKHDEQNKKFRCLKKFYCPFSQNGLALEMRQDHNDLLLKEISDVLLGSDYSLNDQFGNSLQIDETICAIGSPRSHIRGTPDEHRTGHVFIYEKNKGGTDNWGLINILEGIPNTDFGESISIDSDRMAIGAPNAMNGSGVVYIFKKTKRTKSSSWIRLTDVPEGYFYDIEKNKRIGYPSGETLRKINKNTTRWKVKSLIPDGATLGGFNESGFIGNEKICDSGTYQSGSVETIKIGGDLVTHIVPDRLVSSIVSGNLLTDALSLKFNVRIIINRKFNVRINIKLCNLFMSGCIESGTLSEPTTEWWYNIISGCVIESTTPEREVVSKV